MPADQIPVGEGVSPDGKTLVEFFVDRRIIDTLMEHGPVSKYEDARFILEAVARPDAIFEGLARDNHEESLCYTTRIEKDPDDEDGPFSPRYGMVFVVFVVR